MPRSNKCQLLVDSTNVATNRAVFNFLCDLFEYDKSEGCLFGQPTPTSFCQFAREDYCTCPKAKAHLLKKHISKATTILNRLEKPKIKQGSEAPQVKTESA